MLSRPETCLLIYLVVYIRLASDSVCFCRLRHRRYKTFIVFAGLSRCEDRLRYIRLRKRRPFV